MPAQKYDISVELLEEFDINSFLKHYYNVSPNEFILKNKKTFSINKSLLAEQLKLYPKLKHKLPTFYVANCWLTSKSFEQASGELSALYKASLYNGIQMLDICGGLGVDDWAFSKQFTKVISLDIDNELNSIVKCNFNKLGIKNIARLSDNAYDYIENTAEDFDLIYMDADRRVNNKKSFKLEETEPSYFKLEPQLRNLTSKILLKLSPLIDITYCVKNISNLSKIHVVAQQGEVKEILCEIDFEKETSHHQIVIKAVELKDGFNMEYENTFGTDALNINPNELCINYFYEASSALVKSGLQGLYANHLQLNMIDPKSSYYTANHLVESFMGRVLSIKNELIFSKKALTDYLKINNIQAANVSRSHFPLSPEEIKKQFKIKDGGDDYLFFTTNQSGEKKIFHCIKIK